MRMACGSACRCGIELGGGIGWSPVVIDPGWRGDVLGGCGSIEPVCVIGGRCSAIIVIVLGSEIACSR